MVYEVTVFAMLAATVVGGAVGAWLLACHDFESPAATFGFFMLAIAWWAGTHVGTLLAETLRWKLAFTQLAYASVVVVPLLWFAIAMQYADRDEWLTRRRVGLLAAVPAVTLALVFTAQHHSLYYATTSLVEVGGRPVLATTPGPWHAVNVVYSYALLAVGTGLLVRAALSNNRLYRRQSAALVGLVTVPWIVNALYHIGVRPIPLVDPTPLALVAVGVPLAAFVVRSDLTSFLPVAHERVFRTLGDPVVVVTPNGRVLDSNRAARALFGKGRALDGTPIGTVLPASLVDGDRLRSALGDGTVCAIERDGETREYLVRRRRIDPTGDRGARGSILALTDITVQKRRERALERKTAALEEGTERLERTNEQLERLADIVAHDMRAPLSTAEKLLGLLERDLDARDRDDPEAADRARETLADLDAVHGRLREFADHMPRLARESTDVRTTEECDLATVASAAWDVVDTEGVELVVESTRTLRADPRRLQQVFENLFRNAAEHATGAAAPATDGGLAPGAESLPAADRRDVPDRPDAGATDATTVRVGADANGVYVADDGPGIPPERREAVFEYGTSTGDGTGFGLAIVRTIVEAHGWSIAATGSAQGGARFDIAIDD